MAYRPSPMKLVGVFIKILFYCVIGMVFFLLIWRISFSTRIPQDIEKIIVNDKLAKAYGERGDELYMFTQSQASITRAEDNYGYFSVVYYIFIPDAQQLQVIFRYNNSTLEHLAEDYGLTEVPSRGLDVFDLSAVKTTDLTPEDTEDNSDADFLRKERFFPSETASNTTLLYNYRRVVFDNITADDAVGIFFDIFYTGDIDYEDEAYGTLCLYDAQMKNEAVKLTKSDRDELQRAVRIK